MKKSKFYTFIFIILISYLKIYSQEYKKYKVINIDSTSNNYLIYLVRHNNKSIVISPKSNLILDKKKILKGKKYKFNLKISSLENMQNVEPNNSFSISIENKIIWKKGDNFSIYFTDCLEGLYYKSK